MRQPPTKGATTPPGEGADKETPPWAAAQRRRSPILVVMVVVLLLMGVGGALVFLTRQPQEVATAQDAASGGASAGKPTPLSGPPLRFAVPPTIKAEVLRREFAPFLNWLAHSLGRPVELTIADSYDNAAELLTSGGADFGLLPPLLVVRALARDARLQPFALRLYDGSRGSDGYLLVRDDATFANPADLKGHAVCYVDHTSTSGYLLPRIWMRKAGLDPDRDFRVVMSGDHQAAMRDLERSVCDVAAVYSGAYLSARQGGIAVGMLRLFAITGRIPQDALVAGPHLPPADFSRLREAVLRFEPERDIDAGQIGKVLGISGFGPYVSDEFDMIRAAAEQEGLLDKGDAADSH